MIEISENALRIRVEPEDAFSAAKCKSGWSDRAITSHCRRYHTVIVSLQIDYTPNYPDELPDLQVEPLEGDLTEEETEHLLEGMRTAGSESLGMAMVFTLTTWLKDALVDVLEDRSRRLKEAEDKRHAEYEEVNHLRAKLRTAHIQLLTR